MNFKRNQPHNKDRNRPRRRRPPSHQRPPQQQEERKKPIRYGIIFYDTHQAAKSDFKTLEAKAKTVDQLNIVIRAEGEMDDPELLKFGKVYAGAAWTTIHERRLEEGWYNEPH